jgi:hypothetical protein
LTRLKKLYLKGKLLDVPHPFEEELGWLVRTNHRLVLESISRIERDEIALDNLDPTEIHTYSDELRRAANNLALVGLVTRLHHWVSVFVEDLPKQSVKEKSANEIGLIKNLTTLNAALERTESSPIPIDFFKNLVAVRDAIIHADAKSEWTYGDKKKQVSERYANTASGEVDFTETHLQEAIENSVRQVKWYDDQLYALQGTELSPH